MDLDEVLRQFDIAAANLARLDKVWERARSLIPDSIVFGSDPEYEELCRQWDDLVEALPRLKGWRITSRPIDLNALAQWRFDAQEVGELSHVISAGEAADEPTRELEEYRHRLRRARRLAISSRAETLIADVDQTLGQLVPLYERDDTSIVDPRWERLSVDVRELDRLLGDSATRTGRWGELRRHLAWSQGTDLHDIAIHDWPSVRRDIDAAIYPDVEPLQSEDVDLGELATSAVQGAVTVRLKWELLDAEDFERVVYDVLLDAPEYQNVLEHRYLLDKLQAVRIGQAVLKIK